MFASNHLNERDFRDLLNCANSVDFTDSADNPLSIIFDILKAPAFRKYSTCWVFFIFGLCLCLCPVLVVLVVIMSLVVLMVLLARRM